MAKRSDFAQKLLDDLRLRKERMAASPSQRSNQSNHLPIDAYAYTKQTYRGSRNTNGNEIVSSRSGNSRRQMISSMNGSTRELSNQIINIPYENGGKMKRINFSIMGFLQQIKRGGDLDRQLVAPATTNTRLSLVQINEISKGAQKLNHILRSSSSSSSCSNGLIMDTYSLQFAKELLQGAIDLEESLGMLVDLQITTAQSKSHNKNQITLLDEDEGDIDSTTDERKGMQLACLANTMQRPITMTNSSKEARMIKVSEKGISSSSSRSSSNNARIPNVIAKLMGLDNLPEDSGNKQHKLEMTSSKNTAKMMMKSPKVVAFTSRHEEEKNYAQKNLIRDDIHKHPNITSNIQQHKGKVKVKMMKGGGPNDLLEHEVHRRRSQVKSSSIQVTNKHILLSNQNKSQKNHLGAQKSYSYILSKNGPPPREQKQLQVKEGSDIMSIITPKNSPQKKSPAINQPTMFEKSSSHCSGDEAINHTNNKKVKEIINNKWGQISTAKGRNGIKTLKDDKNIAHNKLANKKIKKKVDQMLYGRNGKGNQYIPGLQEAGDGPSNVLNKAKQERFIEADIAPITNIIISHDEPHQEIQSHQNSTNDLHFQGVQSVEINLQNHVVPGAADGGFKICEVELHKTNGMTGTLKEKMGVNTSKSKLEGKKISMSTEQPLTNDENRLKWILVMSQLFTNTAEALFRLNIPFSVLDGDRQECQDQGSKLILDCGFEVMKRKGIRQELRVHNCSKISNNSVNIRSLNDLVRQLNEDMEKLKLYGREKSSHVDVEDYLPIMLEYDVYDIYPDIDCMWDFGWNDETFAFVEKYDVIRDTEKYILSVLLEEITKDCFITSIGYNNHSHPIF